MIGPALRPRVNGLANGKLQEGIYWNARPPGFYTVLLLGAAPDASAADVGGLLARLWGLYQGLKEGAVPALPTKRVPGGDLQVLLGLGARAFELPGRPVDAPPCPKAMRQSFGQPAAGGGGPIIANGGISYEADVTENPADVAIAFQFTAETPLAVERAAVETGKVLSGESSPALSIRAVYTGTQRDDGRSWIDFHDGRSNLAPGERQRAIEIPSPNPPAQGPPEQDRWTSGGTYLAFIRLYIDLSVWSTLELERQEALVGRQKESGLPLKAVGPPEETFGSLDPDGKPPREADPALFHVPLPLPPKVRASHIQRANHHDFFPGGSANPLNHRIYRQGYPFFEPCSGPPGFRVGLNFASFQWTPASLTGMLNQVDWFANTNFGGDGADPVVLLSARAAGFFLVPPVEEGEGFPGERALTGARATTLTRA